MLLLQEIYRDLLARRGSIGEAQADLKELGLKDNPDEPPQIMLDDIIEDICLQTPLGMFNINFFHIVSYRYCKIFYIKKS